MLGENKSIVSLVGADGHFIGDLTRFIVGGQYNRKKNEISQFTGGFNADKEAKALLSKVDTWSTYIRCERDDRDQWEGPVTHFSEHDGILDIVASDMSAYWPRAFVQSGRYNQRDVAQIAESVIERAFRNSYHGLPLMDVSVVGKLLTKSYNTSDYKLISDALSDLAGLDYHAFGRTIFFYGAEEQLTADLKLTDESWFPLPPVEKSGETYANRIVVIGDDVVGVAEAPADEIAYYGLITRRYDIPDITTEAAANFAAAKYLARNRDAMYLNAESLSTLKPETNVELAYLQPGIQVDVAHYVGTHSLQRRLRLNEVSVDCMTGAVSVGLEPLSIPDESLVD